MALVLAALVLSLGAASAQTRSLLVEAPALTGKPVPVALSLDEVRRAVGLAFPIDWDSLRVYDSDGNLIPYQIDDADLSGALSLHDRLAFVVGARPGSRWPWRPRRRRPPLKTPSPSPRPRKAG